MELFKLFGTIAINNSQANKDIDETTGKASDASDKMSGTFKKIGTAVATYFAVDKIKEFGLGCINAAADANAASSQFTQVFSVLEGEASVSLSKIADSAGILETRMKGSYTKIAAFAKTTGMDTDEALSLTERAMVAVADSAAFYDRSLEETTESLQSFLKGNYENDSALGLSCTETTRNTAANKLYGKSFQELSESQKQLTLLQMVEDANELSGALGQASRESDTWTNVTGNLKQSWTDFQAVLGSNILPGAVDVVKKIVSVVEELTAKIPEAVGWFKEHETAIKNVGIALGVAAVAMTAFKAGAVITSIIQGFQKAQVALALYSATTGGATVAQGLLNGTLTVGETLVALLTGKMTLAQLAQAGMTAAQTALNTVLTANPIGLVIAAITALIAIGVLLYKNWDTIKEKCGELWANVTEKFQAIKDSVSEKMESIRETIGTVMQAANDVASEKLSNMKAAYDEHGGGIQGTVAAAIEGVKGYYTAGYDFIDKLTGGKLSALANQFSTKMSSVKQSVSNALVNVKTSFTNGLSNAYDTVTSKLNSIKDKFSDIMQKAKDKVHDAIEAIKKKFKFSWSLPKLKLPHISISGSFSLNPPSVPKFGINWYKKAMDNAMLLNSPTIFGYSAASGKFLGGGEAGSEVVAGSNTLMNMIQNAVTEQNAGLVAVLYKILDAILVMDENMGGNLREALEGTALEINNREFARLVKAVN